MKDPGGGGLRFNTLQIDPDAGIEYKKDPGGWDKNIKFDPGTGV